jgi:ERCC4-type nuclease
MTLLDVFLLIGVVSVLLVTSDVVRDRLGGPEAGTPDAIRQQYERGAIDERELERRLDVAMDPEADRIREVAERVNGIGADTSWAVAAEFDSLQDLREASREELAEIPNVGEQRAAALEEL